uniref:Filament protein n=1 Tax=Philodina roseola TaxID=96448 RepID=B2ZFB3_PHIRO|nr:filament protein [Philodina roseola]
MDLNHLETPFQSSSYQRPTSPYVSSSSSRPSLFNQSREKERLELSTLNDKFADYVEKVRYLEAQNKKIQMETNFLHEKQTDNCQRIKSMFELEMKQLKEIIERTFKDKSTMLIAAKDAQNLLPTSKQQLNQAYKDFDASKYDSEKLERQLSSIEGDMLMYQRRLTHQDQEHGQWKQFITHLQRLLLQGRNEIHNEIISRTSSEQACKQLRVDMSKLRDQYQQKLGEMRQTSLMLGAGSGVDRAHMFKSELSSAIRRVRQDFDRENDIQRQQLYTEFTRMYEDIARLNPELGHLFLNEREQERVRQDEDRIRMDIQRVKADFNVLKQKNAELKLRIREYQINMEMSNEENNRIEQLQENEINQLKVRHEKISQNYDEVMSKQLSLEKEIETYRNLLEGTMKSVVDTISDDYHRPQTPTTPLTMTRSMSSLRPLRSSSVDRSAFQPIMSKKSETNFYSSLINPKYDGKPANNETSFLVIDIPIGDKTTTPTTAGESTTSEENQSSESPPRLTSRPPIVLQTRRNN